MKFVTGAALAAALAIGAVGYAAAQDAARPPTLTREERAAFRAAEAALQARDYAAANNAIAAAKSAARTADARYMASAMELRMGLETNNRTVQANAIEAMIATGAAPQANLEELYKNQGALALSANQTEKAERAFTRWTEIAPNSPEAALALAEVQDDRKNLPGSVAMIERAIQLQRAAGRPVPESWYKRGLKQAFDAKLAQPSLSLAQGLVAAYPSPQNWRDAVLVYRDLYQPDTAAQVDALRLMRSARALSGERDYLEFTQAVEAAGSPGEGKAALDEGVATKMVDPAKPAFKTLIAGSAKKATAGRATLAALEKKATAATTGEASLAAADAYFGYGQYAKAAELYRAAATKGGVDANVANTRLGMALAMNGQRAEAEAALRAVTGPRAALASYWLVWLGQRNGAASPA